MMLETTESYIVAAKYFTLLVLHPGCLLNSVTRSCENYYKAHFCVYSLDGSVQSRIGYK